MPTFSVRDYAPNEALAAHAHDYTNVSVVLRGRLREESAHGIVEAGALALVVKPLGCVHSNTFGSGGATLLSVQWTGAPPGLQEYRWLPAMPPTRLVLNLLEASKSSSRPRDGHQSCLAELQAAVSRAARPTRTGPAPAWLLDIRSRTSVHSRVHALAAGAGVHPVHLTRAYRAFFGETVSQHIRRLRVEEAAHLIVSSEDSFARLALRAGFADQSHLCREFKAYTGITPARYRALIRAT